MGGPLGPLSGGVRRRRGLHRRRRVRLGPPPPRGLRDRHWRGLVFWVGLYCVSGGYQIAAQDAGWRAGLEAALIMLVWIALLAWLARRAPDLLNRWRGAPLLIACAGLMAVYALFIRR